MDEMEAATARERLNAWRRTAAEYSRRAVEYIRVFVAGHRRAVVITGTTLAALLLLAAGLFVYFNHKFERMIEARLGSGSLRTSSIIYAAPRLIAPGDEITPDELIARLQRAGYTDQPQNHTGFYRRAGDVVEIHTGPESYFQPHQAFIEWKKDRIAKIRTDQQGEVRQYLLEPEVITNVLDEGRGKRRPVAYSELPKHLIDALVAVEDKRFFQHNGLDYIRVAKAAWVDLKEGRKEQGASTIHMQIARSFWLDQDKTWGRKLSEAMIASALERRFSKQEILQLYANEVYLGRRGSFSIHGFGEAARAYFGKDVRQLTLAESAMLVGMIQRPSYYNPFRYKDRVRARRDLALDLMHANGYIDAAALAQAKAEPIVLQPAEIESTDAPYFVDLINNELQDQFEDWDFARNAYRIYSTLDLDLQAAAVEAVQAGMAPLVKRFSRRGAKEGKAKLPQVAMVVLDPKTGAIKALIGGRNYGESQLNRVFAMRQPGSTFKPFVYAAGMQMMLDSKGSKGVTPGSVFLDEPTAFQFRRDVYEPANFGDRYMGYVTARRALTLSLNIPTVKVAEQIGYKPVVDLARAGGIAAPLEPTPSLALGSYEVPPIELAEAWTIFSNNGVHVKRNAVSAIRDGSNRVVYEYKPQTNRALDPRVAWLVTNMMEDVIQSGTAGAVRARGFRPPAAGKTGTARDGWFAGYTSELLTVVWVGFDDYSDLATEGSKSALPIWTEFMKRAHKLRRYSDPKPFKAPDGIVRVEIDASTGYLAGDRCANVRTETFIAGTEPVTRCEDEHDFEFVADDGTVLPGEQRRTVFGRIVDVFR